VPAVDAGFVRESTAVNTKEYQELLNSWSYVVQLEHGSDRLYAWRKISTLTQPKKVQSRQATFFVEHKLMDVEDKAGPSHSNDMHFLKIFRKIVHVQQVMQPSCEPSRKRVYSRLLGDGNAWSGSQSDGETQ
jgi:hypothetical protein